MTFLELAKNRYSVRSFMDRPIAEEHMRKILEAGHVAPTACNNQPQKIYIAQSEDAKPLPLHSQYRELSEIVSVI